MAFGAGTAAREKDLRTYSLLAMSEIRVAQVYRGNTKESASTWALTLGAVTASPTRFTKGEEDVNVAASETRAKANTSAEVYRPASCAFPKNEAGKCDATVMEVPARIVRNRSRISEVFVKRSCVKRMELTMRPGR